MQKIKQFIQTKPLIAALVFLAVGGVLALAFPKLASLLRPVAQKVPGNQA